MFEDIDKSNQWIKVEKIDKGWSDDTKYYIETENNEKLLLRISRIEMYDKKKSEYDVVCKYAKTGILMSMPVGFGICDNESSVYSLLTWIEGEDLEQILPKFTNEEQYNLGRYSGEILRKIHNIKVSENEVPKETKVPKKLRQLQRYIDSDVRIAGDEGVIQYVKDNLHKIWTKPPVYQHGDFHPGNLILTPDKRIGVIDFNRWEIGDPYEEFYKLESFGTEASIPFCVGLIDEYFEDNVPDEFWDILSVYVAHASLHSIKWAEKFGQKDIDGMIRRCEIAFANYNNFTEKIPKWYREYKG